MLLVNPLYFHGTKIYRMMVGFHSRVSASRKASMIYKKTDTIAKDD